MTDDDHADGLNDAVALAAADVSVAMGHGSQAVLAGSGGLFVWPNTVAIRIIKSY